MPPVLNGLLTMYKEENQALEALRVGALGYLHKDADPAELLEAIHTVARGEAFLTPQLARRVLAKLHKNDEIPQSEPRTTLSEREVSLLRLVAKGLSNKEIAEELGLSESRIRNQLSDLYHKIQVSGRTQAAMYAVEQSLL